MRFSPNFIAYTRTQLITAHVVFLVIIDLSLLQIFKLIFTDVSSNRRDNFTRDRAHFQINSRFNCFSSTNGIRCGFRSNYISRMTKKDWRRSGNIAVLCKIRLRRFCTNRSFSKIKNSKRAAALLFLSKNRSCKV